MLTVSTIVNGVKCCVLRYCDIKDFSSELWSKVASYNTMNEVN